MMGSSLRSSIRFPQFCTASRLYVTAATFSILLATLALTGCGGQAKSYSYTASKPCLERIGPLTAPTGGEAAALETGGTVANISFERTSSDAKRAVAVVKLARKALGIPTDDILFRRGNVVVDWDAAPTLAQRDSVEACLA